MAVRGRAPAGVASDGAMRKGSDLLTCEVIVIVFSLVLA
jgi:hypothetical protein